MKKIITLMLTLVLALSMGIMTTSCSKGGSDVVNVRTKTITVGYTDYAPMNYKENGVLKGFDTELALMVFNSLGYEVRFKLIEWSSKYLELEGGTIDCIWNGFTANSSDKIGGVDTPREDIVNFSAYYLENNQCVVRKSATAEITDKANFAGTSITFESGSAGADFVGGLTGVYNIGCATQLEALNQVNSGNSDYAVVDRTLAENYVGKGNYSSLVINEGVVIPVEYYAIGFRKDDNGAALRDKVNVMLKAFEATGQLEELATKYNLATRLLTINF